MNGKGSMYIPLQSLSNRSTAHLLNKSVKDPYMRSKGSISDLQRRRRRDIQMITSVYETVSRSVKDEATIRDGTHLKTPTKTVLTESAFFKKSQAPASLAQA